MFYRYKNWFVEIVFKANARSWFFQALAFCVLVLPIVLFGIFSYMKLNGELTDLALSNRESVARLAAITVKNNFDNLKDLAVSFAGRSRVRELAAAGKWKELDETLQEIVSNHALIDRVVVADIGGTIRSNVPYFADVVGQNFAFRDWYKGVSKDWKPYVSEVYKRAAEPRHNVVGIAVPVTDGLAHVDPREGVKAIFLLQVRLDTVLEWISQFKIGASGFIYLVDQNGNLAAHPLHPPQGEIINYGSVIPAQNAVAGRSGIMVFHDLFRGAETVSAYMPVSEYGWGVVVEEPAESAFADRDRTINFFLMVYGMIFVLNLILAYLAVRIVANLKSSESELALMNTKLSRASADLERKVADRTKRIEEALVREDAFLASIGEGMIIINRDQKILAFNEQAQKLTGWTDLSIIGRDLTEVLPMEDNSGNLMPTEKRPSREAMLTGKKVVAQGYYVRRDGTKFPTVTTVAPLVIKGRIEGALEIMHDVTMEKEIDRAKSEFISIASHQLNTPLGIIKWSIDAVRREKYYADLPPGAKEAIDDIEKSNARMIDLVQSLLSVSRIEQNRFDGKFAMIDPTSTIRDVIAEMSVEAERRDVKINFMVPSEPVQIYTDPPKLHEIIENLVSNAIKYSFTGGMVGILLEKKDNNVVISVSDQGIGIPQHEQKRILSKFFRAENALLSDTKGTGLGLYVVKSYADRWGWPIWYESAEGSGTTFHLAVPADKTIQNVPIMETVEKIENHERPKRILIAEDEKVYAKVIKNRLMQEGYDVVEAVTGDECLSSARLHKPDLILLDLMMPIKDGFAALQELKADPNLRDVNVIVLSNLSQDDDINKAKVLGADEFIVKSHATLGEVVEKVVSLLAKQKQHER